MSTALKNRLVRIEAQTRRENDGQGFEVWFGGADGSGVEGPKGEVLSAEEFTRRYSDAIPIDPSNQPYEGYVYI